MIRLVLISAIISTVFSTSLSAQDDVGPVDLSKTVSVLYPSLASGILRRAVVGDLPDGVLVQSGEYQYRKDQLEELFKSVPPEMNEQVRKNEFFVVEQTITTPILARTAKQHFEKNGEPLDGKDDNEVVNMYLKNLVSSITVSSTEVETFYSENKDMCGGVPIEDIDSQLRKYILDEKRQNVIQKHIENLGDTIPIILSKQWVDRQVKLALDNPVDKVRNSGIPSVVDFGASGCRPCDMMSPILEELKTKYAGKANVVFVHVRKEKILAARYGIRSIPVQVFFDASGKEVFRHTGFFPMAEMEKKMAEAGVAVR